MFAFIINHFPAVCVMVAVFLTIAAVINSSRKRRAEVARIQAEEATREARIAAAIEKRRQAAARRIAREAAAKETAARQAAVRQQKREEKEAAREAREAAAAKRRAEKLEAARLLAEYQERSLAAARALRELEATPVLEAREAPAPDPVPEAAPAPAQRPETIPAGAFSGQVVSFTGKLQSMKRADAIKAVQAAGGRAYSDFPAGTTILVVGTNPGQKKQEKFDRWIGQVKKITEAQFIERLQKGA